VTEFLRRRIKWRQNQCTAEISENERSLIAWNCKSLEYNDALKELVPLKDPEWELYVDGIEIYANVGDNHFKSEEELKCYIIRYVYDIPGYLLIPSEMLYDAGLVYVTNCWVDDWKTCGYVRVEHRNPLPDKPAKRNINLPAHGETARDTYLKSRKRRKTARNGLIVLNEQDEYPDEIRQGTKVHEDHRTSLRLVPRYPKPRPYEPRRLHRGDDMELSWQEEQEVWIADYIGAGTDEFDTLDDDECYYVLETGECDAQTCAIVTIDPETSVGEEGPSQVQNAGETAEAEARELHPNDLHRLG
jgi:hypothetical protein